MRTAARTARLGIVAAVVALAGVACSSDPEPADSTGTTLGAGTGSTVGDAGGPTTSTAPTTGRSPDATVGDDADPVDPDLPAVQMDGTACAIASDVVGGQPVLRITGTLDGEVPDGTLVLRLDDGTDLIEVSGDLADGTFDIGGPVAPGTYGVVEAIVLTSEGEAVDLSLAFAMSFGQSVTIGEDLGAVAGAGTCPEV